MVEIALRRAVPEDAAALSAIWFAASMQAHGFLGGERLAVQRRLVETVYLPRAETWIAGDPAPLGFVSLLDDFIGGLFVAPPAQGRGIGHRLIAQARALRGHLMLDCYTANVAAMRFYAAQGFREVARNPVDAEGLPFETVRLILP